MMNSEDGDLVVITNVAAGPMPVGQDRTLLDLLARSVAVLSAAAINLIHVFGKSDDADAAAKRLTALSVLVGAGEIRALIVLCTTGLAIHSRIHLRGLDEALRRIAVYAADPAFAKQSEEALDDFKADGFAKMSTADFDRVKSRDDEAAALFNTITANAKKPLMMTKHAEYKKHAVGLDEFERSSYSQVEHVTILALAEVSGRLSTNADSIYATDDAELLLGNAAGIALTLCAYLNHFGVEIDNDFQVLKSALKESLISRGLLDPAFNEDDEIEAQEPVG